MHCNKGVFAIFQDFMSCFDLNAMKYGHVLALLQWAVSIAAGH